MKDQSRNAHACGWMTTDGSTVWYLTYQGGILFRIDNMSGEIEYVSRVPDNDMEDFAYRTIMYHQGNIYIFPYNNNKIWKYYIQTDKYDLICSNGVDGIYKDKAYIFGAVVLHDEIYMYGLNSIIARYNTRTGDFYSWDTADLITSFKPIHFWKNGFAIKDSVIIPIAGREAVIIMSNNQCSYLEWNIDTQWHSTIVLPYGNKVCFVGINENGDCKVDLLNPDNKQIIERGIKKYSHNSAFDGEIPFSSGIILDGNLIIMPGCQPYGYMINLEEDKSDEFILKEGLPDSKNLFVFCGIFISNSFICIDWLNCSVITRGLKSNNTQGRKIFASKRSLNELFKIAGMSNSIINEDPIMTVEAFIESI